MSGRVTTLGQIATTIRNGLFAKRPTYDPSGTPILRISAVRDGRVFLSDLRYVDSLTPQAIQKFAVREHDLLITRYNGSRHLVGIAGLVPSHRAPLIHPDKLIRVQVDPAVADARFVNLQLGSPQVRNFLEPRIRTTAGQSGIAGGDVRAIPLWLPPLEEQRRLVEILEDHLSRLDAATTYLESAGARQARLVDRYLSAALAALSPPVRPVGELLSQPLINGRSVPTAEGGFPVLRLTALRQGRVDLAARKAGAWTAREAAPFLVQQRDFLISRGNGSRRLVGLGGLVVTEPDPVAFPDTLIRIRTKADTVHPEFLALVWNGSDVRRQIEAAAKTTAGIYKINQKDVERVVLPVPTMTQQVSLAADVAAFQDSVERLDRARAAVASRVQTLRRALLAEAFSGRLG